jgi:hypothetical protein
MKEIEPLNGIDATIYLKTEVTLQDVALRLRQAVGGTIRGHTVNAGAYEVDVIGNDERPRGAVDPSDEFLLFPYLVEVEWLDGNTPTAEMVAGITTILGELDRLGAEYVTAADFEHELPRGGRSP